LIFVWIEDTDRSFVCQEILSQTYDVLRVYDPNPLEAMVRSVVFDSVYEFLASPFRVGLVHGGILGQDRSGGVSDGKFSYKWFHPPVARSA